MSGSLGDTLELLRNYAGDEASLAELIGPFFPVSSVSLMTLGILPAATVSASDRLAARVDELQLDLGEGPAWDCLRDARPVYEYDLRSAPQRTWLAFSEAVSHVDVGALFVFPLRVGHLHLGAMTLLHGSAMKLSAEHVTRAGLLAGSISTLILRRAMEGLTGGDDGILELHSRRTIYQATGMVIAQADVPAAEAELLIRGHAFAENMTMRQVASEILQRRLSFEAITMGSEER